MSVDAFGTFLRALREYEREGQVRIFDDLGAPDVQERIEAVRRILLRLHDEPGRVPADSLLDESSLARDEFLKVLESLVTVGFAALTIDSGGMSVELTDRGRAAAAAF